MQVAWLQNQHNMATNSEIDNTDPHDTVRAVSWRDEALWLMDQRRLPAEEIYLRLETCAQVEAAIRDMVVRGAPAIGVAAAYAVVMAAREAFADHGSTWKKHVRPALDALAGARPTAVNLSWAVRRMAGLFEGIAGDPAPGLLEQALDLHARDIRGNREMGKLGAALLSGGGVLTHCNAGSLATGGYGTALGVIRSGYAAGSIDAVYACETRPWLQGARLTAWELQRDKVPVTVIADSAAASLMRTGRVKWLIVGADRIAASGDVANKIGTYSLAVLARHHGVRVMVVAPTSTIDPALESGEGIPIEHRPGDELRAFQGAVLAPAGAAVLNPVFDVTPADLVDFLVTEKGVVEGPETGRLAALLGDVS